MLFCVGCWTSVKFPVFLSPQSSLFSKVVLLQGSAMLLTTLLIHAVPAILASMLFLRHAQHDPFSWPLHLPFPLSRTLPDVCTPCSLTSFRSLPKGTILCKRPFLTTLNRHFPVPLYHPNLLYSHLKALSPPDICIDICVLHVSFH